MQTTPTPAATRERILQVALELFAGQGYLRTSVRDIAERVGITKAAVHYHFPRKIDIMLALAEPVWRDFETMISEAERLPDPRWPAIEGWLDVLLKHRRVFEMIAHDPAFITDEKTYTYMFTLVRRVLAVFAGPDAAFSARMRAAQAMAVLSDPVFLFPDAPDHVLRTEALAGVRRLMADEPLGDARHPADARPGAGPLDGGRLISGEGNTSPPARVPTQRGETRHTPPDVPPDGPPGHLPGNMPQDTPGNGHLPGNLPQQGPPTGHLPGNLPQNPPDSGHLPGTFPPERPPTGHLPGNMPQDTPGNGHLPGNLPQQGPPTGHLPGNNPQNPPDSGHLPGTFPPERPPTGHLPGNMPQDTPGSGHLPGTSPHGSGVAGPLDGGRLLSGEGNTSPPGTSQRGGGPRTRRGPGRPAALTDQGRVLARRMHAEGQRAEQIATALGVSRATVYRYLQP